MNHAAIPQSSLAPVALAFAGGINDALGRAAGVLRGDPVQLLAALPFPFGHVWVDDGTVG
jgi:hypothetical protein